VDVAKDDGNLGAGDDEDGKDEEEEAKHVVEAVLPDRGEDEEHLDKDDSEGEEATDDKGADGGEVPGLGGGSGGGWGW